MAISETTDQELVMACLEGNRDAFAQLVIRHQDSVFGLAVSMTRNHTDAADMAQEAFVRAYRKLHQYNPSLSFRSWLLKICANQTKNLFRKRMNRKRVEEEYALEETMKPDGQDPDYTELEEALSRLPARLGAALRLRYMESMDYAEISMVLGIGVSAAKMRVMRARNLIAGMLDYEKAS